MGDERESGKKVCIIGLYTCRNRKPQIGRCTSLKLEERDVFSLLVYVTRILHGSKGSRTSALHVAYRSSLTGRKEARQWH